MNVLSEQAEHTEKNLGFKFAIFAIGTDVDFNLFF